VFRTETDYREAESSRPRPEILRFFRVSGLGMTKPSLSSRTSRLCLSSRASAAIEGSRVCPCLSS
jgi:hypothetical protein